VYLSRLVMINRVLSIFEAVERLTVDVSAWFTVVTDVGSLYVAELY